MMMEAAKCGDLEIFYQPKIDLSLGTLVSVQTLIRWRRGMANLERMQKDCNLIDFRHWMITKAIQQISDWQKAGFQIPVCVNVLASELINKSFCDWLNDTFRNNSDVDPSMLEFEIVDPSQICDPSAFFFAFVSIFKRKNIEEIDENICQWLVPKRLTVKKDQIYTIEVCLTADDLLEWARIYKEGFAGNLGSIKYNSKGNIVCVLSSH